MILTLFLFFVVAPAALGLLALAGSEFVAWTKQPKAAKAAPEPVTGPWWAKPLPWWAQLLACVVVFGVLGWITRP